MPYNPRGAFTRLETIGCRSSAAFSDLHVPSMTCQADKSRNRPDKDEPVIINRIYFVILFIINLRFSDSIGR